MSVYNAIRLKSNDFTMAPTEGHRELWAIQPVNEIPRNMLEFKTSNKEVEF